MTDAKLTPNDEKILSASTYYVPGEYYDVMTHIAAFISKEPAIVLSTDGRATDKDNNVLSDEEIKIHEQSSLCAVMFTGKVPSTLYVGLDLAAEIAKEHGIASTTVIAEGLLRSLTKPHKNLFKQEPPNFHAIVAGYDIEQDGSYSPHLYVVYNDEHGTWVKREPGAPYLHAGMAFHAVQQKLKDEFNENMSLYDMNKFALNTLKVAEKDQPKSVGGQPTLWNITPDDSPIVKLSSREIEVLRS